MISEAKYSAKVQYLTKSCGFPLSPEESISPPGFMLFKIFAQFGNKITNFHQTGDTLVKTHKNTSSCCGSCGAESIFSSFIISLEKPGCELRLDWRKGSNCDATALVSHRFNWRSCSIYNVT